LPETITQLLIIQQVRKVFGILVFAAF